VRHYYQKMGAGCLVPSNSIRCLTHAVAELNPEAFAAALHLPDGPLRNGLLALLSKSVQFLAWSTRQEIVSQIGKMLPVADNPEARQFVDQNFGYLIG
jgi:hypothetical protein